MRELVKNRPGASDGNWAVVPPTASKSRPKNEIESGVTRPPLYRSLELFILPILSILRCLFFSRLNSLVYPGMPEGGLEELDHSALQVKSEPGLG